jgi:hypothetical protein
MRFLKLILDFYINASIHVALGVFALVCITEMYFELPYNEPLSYFLAKLHHRSLTNDLKIIQIFSLICFLAMCFYAYQLPLKTLLLTIPFELLTVLYAVPFLSGFQKSLRSVSYLKVIVVAFVWGGFTVLLPLFDAEKEMTITVFFYAIQRFLIVVVLILPFDIRDVKYDAISLQTIPKKIGVQKTKKLGLILLLFALIIEFMSRPSLSMKSGFMIFFFVTILFLMRAKINQSKYYSSFWVEAIPVFWWLLLLGIHNF